MKTKSALFLFVALAGIAGFLLLKPTLTSKRDLEESRKERKAAKTRFAQERMKYEFDMLKDPKTGKIPYRIREQELAFARNLPQKGEFGRASVSGASGLLALNNYIPAGPNNIGGRTRAVAYDRRYNGNTNLVIIAGCVSGGILRSADGGNTWTRVTPENETHNLTALAQDPTNPDVWYAGGGEAYGNTASEIGASYLGFGILKSVNNGLTWTKLPLNTIMTLDGTGIYRPGSLESFDHPFDFIHKIEINPLNGDVYISGHQFIVKSTDGGSTFRVVFDTQSNFASNGQSDLVITSTGSVILAVNGGAAVDKRGVWVSNTGDPNSWTRIAGGKTLGVDSVAGWRANSYAIIRNGTPPQYSSKRIVVALAPSNNNIAYFFYENGLSSDEPDLKPEADLFRLDIAGSTYTWTNRSANMPDFTGGNLSGSDPLTVQNGYDMEVKVKPDNPDVVFVGGTNLYRSTDGFASTTNTAWINGYRSNFTYAQYPNGHADIHRLVFSPANPNVAICGDDGGIRQTADITSAAVSWLPLPNYQTVQYYYVAIDPGAGRNNFVGGAQDNGVLFRDKLGILGTAPADSNNHVVLFSADGASVGLSALVNNTQYVYESLQFGDLRRVRITPTPRQTSESIKPANLTPSNEDDEDNFGEFVTNFSVHLDNPEDLYYVNFNRLFRTTSASTVTASTGWTEMTGVSRTVNPNNPTSGRDTSIRALGFSRGPYATSNALYIGTTAGQIFRLDDPRNAAASAVPVNITPTGLAGNVQDIAVNPNNESEIMAVVSNYGVVGIWYTSNAKAARPTWHNAEGNLTLPSMRSCAIVVKKDAANNPVTEYYVGTSVGLYSTANLSTLFAGGGTPTWQREGGLVLNYAVIQDIAYRPVDNVMLLGTHGDGMYYTYLGTANFTPNVPTGINDPITNDRNFIRTVYPTASRNAVYYTAGNMFTIKKMAVQVISLSGQVVLSNRANYADGQVNIANLATGNYILSITSEDGKYRHVQKFLKQ